MTPRVPQSTPRIPTVDEVARWPWPRKQALQRDIAAAYAYKRRLAEAVADGTISEAEGILSGIPVDDPAVIAARRRILLGEEGVKRCTVPGCDRPLHSGSHGPVTNPVPDPNLTAVALYRRKRDGNPGGGIQRPSSTRTGDGGR